MGKRLLGATLVAVGLFQTASAPAAPHRAKTVLRTIDVQTEYRMPPGTVEAPVCDGTAPAPCYFPIRGTETMTGTFAATGTWTGRVWPRTDPPDGDMGFDGLNFMRGTIAGCGSGSFTYVDVDGTLFTSRFDPLTQSFPARNQWVILPGSVTGELAERFVSGHGEQRWRSFPFNQDPAREDWGGGTITGEVVCRVPVSRKASAPRARRDGRRAAARRSATARGTAAARAR